MQQQSDEQNKEQGKGRKPKPWGDKWVLRGCFAARSMTYYSTKYAIRYITLCQITDITDINYWKTSCALNIGPSTQTRFILQIFPAASYKGTTQPAHPPTAQAIYSSRDT